MDATIITSTCQSQWRQTAATPAAATDLDLRLTDRRDQTWQGFGGCFNELGWLALSQLSDKARDGVIRELFDPADGCRFTQCRLPIGANDYAAQWYSHDETPDDLAMEHFSIERDRRILLPYIKAALAVQPALKLFASPWSPPTWMKFPRAYNYGTMIWQPEILQAYALYFAKFVEAYAAEGVRIDQIHLQNEPLADQKFPSCLWTGEQMRDFLRDYLAPTFAARRLDCQLWLGTLNTDDYDGFVNTALTDPGAYDVIAGVGVQWAGKSMVQRIRAAWPEKPILQTENECGRGENSWDDALYTFSLMQHYITNGVAGYTYWNMTLPPGGQSTWGWDQNAMITVDPETQNVTYNPEFYVMKHFSRFIEPGAKRIEVAGCLAGNAVAFANIHGARIAVVANPLKTDRTCTIGDASQAVTIDLPAASVTTVELIC